jgi:hypothetical protein
VLEGGVKAPSSVPAPKSSRSRPRGANRPEPLVAAHVYVGDLDSFMLNQRRLRGSELVALSNGEEFKAHWLLLCHAWGEVPAASLPNDDRSLAHFSGAGTSWAKVRVVAMRGFVLCSDNRYYHPVLAAEVERAFERKQAYLNHKAANRKRQADWRASRMTERHGHTDVTRDITPASPQIREEDKKEAPIPNNSSTAAREVVKEDEKNISSGSLRRSAPSDLKAIKKQKLQVRLMRYCLARFGQAECAIAVVGLCGDDPNPDHNAQWWFDTLDRRMRIENWNDRRPDDPNCRDDQRRRREDRRRVENDENN